MKPGSKQRDMELGARELARNWGRQGTRQPARNHIYPNTRLYP